MAISASPSEVTCRPSFHSNVTVGPLSRIVERVWSMAKPGFYAVQVGRKPGVYSVWADAERQVRGFPGAKHKKFPTKEEAEAYIKGRITSSSTQLSGASNSTTLKRRATQIDDEGEGMQSGKVPQYSSRKRVRAANPVFGTRASASVPGRTVFCDGSSRGNGQHGATAGIGVFWGHEEGSINLAERLPGNPQTNNRAEIYAVARILETDPMPHLPLTICTDSQYTISIFSEWIPGWRRNGWRASSGKPVMNVDMIRYVLSLLALRAPDKGKSKGGLLSNVTLVKVKAHVGIDGNEQADRLANEGALMPQVPDIDFEKLTKENERRMKEKQPDLSADSIEFNVVPADLASREELEHMSRTQEF
ncbi:hypothetical protein OIV83_001457 [Microbotryomycetes sp. JL201]|nr:hypothetical protein OIV83_001457 [Microbotryomycetes sp. JL201]